MRKFYEVDDALYAIIKRREATRRSIMILVWDYIRHEKLQDPENKRFIIPDQKMKKIIPKRTSMLRLTPFVNKHIIFHPSKKSKGPNKSKARAKSKGKSRGKSKGKSRGKSKGKSRGKSRGKSKGKRRSKGKRKGKKK